MGLIDNVKNAFGASGTEQEEDLSFEDEFQEPQEDEMMEEEEIEEETVEWDTAYQFADDFVSEVGFSGMSEFIDKAMIYRINMSPMYRDRIESGVQTMNMITSSMSEIHDVQSRFSGDKESANYNEYVEQVRAANDLIDELDRMEGREEQIADEVMGIARDAVDAMKESKTVGGGSVDSSIGVVEEDR